MIHEPKLYDNFFTDEEVNTMDTSCRRIGTDTDWIDQHGIWKGQLVGKFKILNSHEAPEVFNLLGKVRQVFDREVMWTQVLYQELYKPWDIHTDWRLDGAQYNMFTPMCIILIPFEDINSRTIFFKEKANFKDFYKYKESNPKSTNPVPKEFWDENLDFCWPEDREYLTLDQVMPLQRKGQLYTFPRDVFHSSDNFHKKNDKPKRFLQVVVDSYV